jgi:hypothetical protein
MVGEPCSTAALKRFEPGAGGECQCREEGPPDSARTCNYIAF